MLAWISSGSDIVNDDYLVVRDELVAGSVKSAKCLLPQVRYLR